MRKDFPEIYCHAKTKGLMVTVFTNGTMVRDSLLELFENLPPQAIEISLYGATAATYERITGVEGSFERCLTGIRKLLEHRINVRLKTVLMTLNRHEYAEMERMAQAYGVKFRFDAAITARLNGDGSPLRLRVSPREAAEKEFSGDLKTQQWREHVRRYSDCPASDTLYNCGAGIITFHITSDGHVQPCLMTTRLTYDLSKGRFLEGWREVMPRIREIKVASDYPCNRCEKRVLCGFCPPSFELEDGAGNAAPSEYHCAMSQRRLELINTHL
jgi:radical SAM protein with 4Fe4S-binding SPASM domain